jgi:methionyl-tRNA formyltransferase
VDLKYYSTIQQFNNSTIQQFNNSTIQKFNNSKIQPFKNSTIQPLIKKALEDLRIVFMGTPEFAVASLHKLVNAGCNIVGVITAPDKEAGRGMLLQQSAVKKYAVENNLNTLQPEKLKNPEFLAELKALNADLQIVVAFRMLPEVVWNMPPMGSVNLHGSLLPKYRGAAPINWAVINGETETGVTTFKLQHAIDTGNILMQASFAISDTDTAGEIHDTMKEIGAMLLVKTVQALAENTISESVQIKSDESPDAYPHAPKIFTETCKIDFKQTTTQVYNFIRGLAPYPAAFTFLEGKKLKIYAAQKVIEQTKYLPGNYVTDEKTFLHFTTADGYINLVDIQLEGKKRMEIKEFLRGYRFVNKNATL